MSNSAALIILINVTIATTNLLRHENEGRCAAVVVLIALGRYGIFS